MVLIERIDCRHPVRTVNRLGATSPVTATSTGLAVLALMPDEEVERVLAEPVPRLTARTVTLRSSSVGASPRCGGWIRGEPRPEPGRRVRRGRRRRRTLRPAGRRDGLFLPDSRFDARRVPWWARQLRDTAAAVAAG